MEKAIHQCTETDFPNYTLHLQHNSEVHIGKRDIDSDIIHINIPNEYAYFLPYEFKNFTESCNAILEWLDND